MLPLTKFSPPKPLRLYATRLLVSPRMSLMDVNAVRLVLGKDLRAASRDMEEFTWTWDIAVHGSLGPERRMLRCLVDEISDECPINILDQTPAQIIDRVLGTRTEWGVTEISNLLLCSPHHVHELMQGRSPALPKCSKRAQPIRIARPVLAKFLLERLVNKLEAGPSNH